MERSVIALGGNAILGPGDRDQSAVVEATAERVAGVVTAGHEVVLTHGNGPQVGNRILQQEAAPDTPQHSLDVLVAETQAQIGYRLQNALDGELGGEHDFVTMVTQVVVDGEDPGFDDPTKPVGPYYTESEAREKDFPTKKVGTGDRAYRRVVASPEPLELVESDDVAAMVERGNHVVCAGGGGVPVVRDDGLCGVDAVVDKDRTSQLVATDLDAETLVFLTDVEFAYRNYGTDDQTPVEDVDAAAVRDLLDAGEFGEGTMRPKMEACARFVEAGGDRALVTTPENLDAALDGETGTRVES
ncbi:carbamate kinase [Haloplanus sp. GCM10025708]|uniref:carbamate kinase n=1 Tax=Haloferacaceae TaxID=1644056 RepID=UPI00361807FB